MSTVGRLDVELGLDSSKLDKGLKEEGKRLNKWGDSLKGLGSKMTAGLTLPVLGGFAKMIQDASHFNESISAVKATFLDSSDAIIKSSEKAADTYGLSATQFLDASKVFGSIGVGAGLAGDDLVGFSDDLIKAAVDMASFNDIPVDEALLKLQSGLAGEAEPLRSMQIYMSEAALQTYALANGIGTVGEALTEEQKLLARQGLIMEQYTNGTAFNDFAETSAGFAGQLKKLKSELADTSVQLGLILIPYAFKGIKIFRKLMAFIKGLSDRQKKWGLVIAGTAAVLGPLLIIIGAMLPALSLLLGPFGLIILALVGLGIAYRSNFLGFGDAVNAVAGYLRTFIPYIITFGTALKAAFTSGKPISELIKQFPGPLQQTVKGFLLIADAIGDLVARWQSGGFGAMLDLLPQKLAQIGDGFKTIGKEILKGLVAGIKAIDWGAVLKTAAKLLLAGFLLHLKLAWALIKLWFRSWKTIILEYLPDLASWLFSKGKDLIHGLGQGIKNKWPEVREWLIGLGGKAAAALGTAVALAADKLKEKGAALLAHVFDGIESLWGYASKSKDTLLGWLTNMPGMAADALKTAIATGFQTLKDQGRSLLTKVKDGLEFMWDGSDNSVKGWLTNLPDKMASALGALAGALYDMGRALMTKVSNGLLYVWEYIIIPWLKKLNPLNYIPSPGFEWPFSFESTGDSFRSAGSSMAMASSGSSSGPPIQIIIQGYNRDPRELAGMVAAVLNRELDLYSGTVN